MRFLNRAERAERHTAAAGVSADLCTVIDRLKDSRLPDILFFSTSSFSVRFMTLLRSNFSSLAISYMKAFFDK